MGLQRSMQCSKEQYWDELLQSCKSCRLACHPPKFKECLDFCSSMDCRKRMGFYYDKLLLDCIDCSGVCGQHPKECEPFCQRTRIWDVSGVLEVEKQGGLSEDPGTTVPVPAVLQGAQCQLDPTCDPRMSIYIGLGLFLCTLFFLLLTWFYFRKRGEEVTCQPSPVVCHKKGGNPKDRLMEEGSMKGGSSGSQTPEPIETCGFCFPEVSPAIQETRACQMTYQPGAQGDLAVPGNMGTIPTPEDGHFQIICSPSQEKMHMT
ncbi:tumor necrosis factor receptor superfamily member 13B [Sceloporus undulatus]|uniref:tumor necrosis factor receptor superfamily member 13B n=1 Tax=Sceloporus undulatus TaxID=8520 RepID=UPI001C4BBCD7|nr:tumor necrosis factor receptor superfamily member 13B [Sceloporus undulatus]